MNIKSDFPIFKTYPELIYLDNGATTQKPQIMLDSLIEYYSKKNSNIGRSVYKLAEISEVAYENSRKKIANFVGANKKNIIFTKGATESLNQAAYVSSQLLKSGSKILLSIYEHHANILPWQKIAQEKNLQLIFIDNEEYLANPEKMPESIWDNVSLVALTHVSNVTGQIHPVAKWCKIAREKNIITCIDGSQGVVSEQINLSEINCDFYAFSAHKLYGPMGLGILYIHQDILNKKLHPSLLGGGIIEEVLKENYTLLEGALRFEAGTPNVADVYAFAQTLDYLKDNNWQDLLLKSHKLTEYLIEQLSAITEIAIIKPKLLPVSHMVSFVVNDVHAHDLGTYLSNYNICVRVGKHCAHPLHDLLDINSSVRASIGIYNTQEDIDHLIIYLRKAIKFFGE